MVSMLVFLLSLRAAATAGRDEASVSPVEKVLELMNALYQQVRIAHLIPSQNLSKTSPRIQNEFV